MNQDWESQFHLQTPEHEEIDLANFNCIVVDGKGHDLIFQIFEVKIDDFEELIAEVIEEHFGATEGFAIEYVPEMSMYGLLYKDARTDALFNKEFHVYEFLDLVSNTITELQK